MEKMLFPNVQNNHILSETRVTSAALSSIFYDAQCIWVLATPLNLRIHTVMDKDLA